MATVTTNEFGNGLALITELHNKARDPEFVKFCAECAPDAGITPAEWADSKKKVAFILMMAKLEIEVEASYKKMTGGTK